MNTGRLKAFGPKARRELLRGVEARAAKLGITAKGASPLEMRGDVALIDGVPYPRSVGVMREALRKRVADEGFARVMEAAAYTWFNRLMALRYMEVHGYLEHGFCVLSDPAGPDNPNALPQILHEAENVELPGVDRAEVIALKLDGTKDAELFAILLKGQCRALHKAMPFLFETIDDDTELLLPENLLHSGSIVRGLVNEIDAADWQSIEIVGWLYQFYISEKKDEVIGKVVKSEDIPAATQLFTPNWIVKYMVQNSLGAQWLATYPDSPLKGQMEYYIEPAEQTDEVKAQLAAITPSQLNPEELTLIDPACGSGHILVEAYDLFKAIYLERGYRLRDVPQLILEKNLFGLDIDERAAQLTGFALLMKGRADDPRLFERGVKINVMALVDSAGLDVEALAKGVSLSDYEVTLGDLAELKKLFEHATTFGSLIQVPEGLAERLPQLKQLSDVDTQDLFSSTALKRLGDLVQQAEMLAERYDAVIANPPYMGGRGMYSPLKKFAQAHFPNSKENLFACFIERANLLTNDGGHNALITMQSWMFLPSFERMRRRLSREMTIVTMAHLGAGAFGSISGEVVQTTAFVLKNRPPLSFKPMFFRLIEGDEEQKRSALSVRANAFHSVGQVDFQQIPGCPIAYWAGKPTFAAFNGPDRLETVAETRKGMVTASNATYVRHWFEVDRRELGLGISDRESARNSGCRWFPYLKGGGFRRWYGNRSEVVDWADDGQRLRTTRHPTEDRVWATNFNLDHIFEPNVNWSDITGGLFAARISTGGSLFDATSLSCFPETSWQFRILGFLNSRIADSFLQFLNPTLHYQAGNIADLPSPPVAADTAVDRRIEVLVNKAREDWDAYERSWDFQSLPLLTASPDPTPTLESSYTAWTHKNRDTIAEMKRLEEENNRLFIDAYGLQDELTPEVPLEQITLTVNPAYRYGGKLSEDEQGIRFRQDSMEELISYAVGCMMGRYSLDEPGLIYAHSGNEGFDPGRYKRFPADDDGIVPITDNPWFDDDAANRLSHFIAVAWPKEHQQENLKFLADNLSPKSGEAPRDTIRRYLCTKFFKDHLQTYKHRPIYWLVSSGQEKAFEALVYLHRYNAGTLARMRTEYVIPLAGKLKARIAHLDNEEQAAGSAGEQRKLAKEKTKMEKKSLELLKFDEKLKHYADQHIELDLDDGVKVNYGKFGDLLADVKSVTGAKGE